MSGGAMRRLRVALSVALLLLSVLMFVFSGSALAELASLQFGPALLSFAAGLSSFSLAAVAGILAATLLFGRIFCAMACPLGAIQDGARAIFHGEAGTIPNLKVLRYAIAFTVIAGLMGGWALGFRLLDPFSRFGSMVNSSLSLSGGGAIMPAVGGLASLLAIILLVCWKRRIFCASLCPVGTILGFFSRRSLYRIRPKESCIGCGRCERACPTGCIDCASGVIASERCVLCLDCLAVCDRGAIGYLRGLPGRQEPETPPVNPARRAFLVKSVATIAAMAVVGYGLRKLAGTAAFAGDGGVLPPGAGDAARFARLCTSCQLCASACPTRAIQPTASGFGSVTLDFDQGCCDFNCVRCSEVCPTGALRRLTLEDKQWLRIGEAVLESTRCRIAAQGEPCSLCTRACPMGAIHQPDPGSLPEVNAYHCIGCGACQSVCPTAPKAIIAKPIERQESI